MDKVYISFVSAHGRDWSVKGNERAVTEISLSREYEKKDKRVGELCERIKAIELGADFRALFNNSKGLFYLGYFVSEEKPDSIMYDMYMSEMRSTDYYAIGRGIVRENHWSALSRPVTANLFGVGMLSWSGTAFEYFMPHLLLPVYKNSFAEEALSFTFAEQVKYGARVNGQRFFGISESGYYAFDEALGYQYRAFGVPSVSRRRERSMEMVYSPYSTFLMMRSNYYMCMKNLESLKKIGMYGECGFFEAIDLTPARTPKPAIVKSFMSHHIGMSLVACANAVFDDIFVRRFMKDVEMRAVGELLKEAVPTEVGNVKIKNHFTESPQKIKLPSSSFESSLRSSAVMTALTGRETSLVLFERGVVSLDISFQRGEPVSAIRPLDATHSPSLFLFALCDGKVYSPTISPDVSVMCSESYCEYRQGHLKAGISLSAKTPALRIKMEAEAREGEVGLYFEPLLCDKESFLSHPAFSNLFIKATVQEGVLVMTRVYERPYSLALFCTS
ncbi:MAG: hypothetical protein IKY62_02155, partial [Clostridia bacterium]|nr:hypothetical protein [Clostridia bacterium]